MAEPKALGHVLEGPLRSQDNFRFLFRIWTIVYIRAFSSVELHGRYIGPYLCNGLIFFGDLNVFWGHKKLTNTSEAIAELHRARNACGDLIYKVIQPRQ